MRRKNSIFAYLILFCGLLPSTGYGDLIDLHQEEKPAPKEPAEEAVPAEVKKPPEKEPEKKIVPVEEKKKEKTTGEKTKQPVFFEGDTFSGFKSDGFIELNKNVVITNDSLRMTSEKAKIFFKQGKDDVEKVEAIGKVEMTRIDPETHQEIKASGDTALFEAEKEIVTLKNNAKLHRGKDVFQGSFIEYDMKTGQIKAGKVRGLLTPENINKETKKKSP